MKATDYFVQQITSTIQNCPGFVPGDDSVVVVSNKISLLLREQKIHSICGCFVMSSFWAGIFVDVEKSGLDFKNDESILVCNIPNIKKTLEFYKQKYFES